MADDLNFFECDGGEKCCLTEEKIDSYNIDDFDEILDLLDAHKLNLDAADDVAEAQVLLRKHIQTVKKCVRKSEESTSSISLVKNILLITVKISCYVITRLACRAKIC